MTTKTKGGKKVANNNKIDFDKVNEYARELGIGAKGKKRDGFINEVLDAIVSQYTEYEEKMDEKDFETYKKESQEMLQFYMDNKDYGQEAPPTVKEDEKAQESVAEPEKDLATEETNESEAEEGKDEKKVVEEKAKKKTTVKKTKAKEKVEKDKKAIGKETDEFGLTEGTRISMLAASLKKKSLTMSEVKALPWNKNKQTEYNNFNKLVEKGIASKDKDGKMGIV